MEWEPGYCNLDTRDARTVDLAPAWSILAGSVQSSTTHSPDHSTHTPPAAQPKSTSRNTFKLLPRDRFFVVVTCARNRNSEKKTLREIYKRKKTVVCRGIRDPMPLPLIG